MIDGPVHTAPDAAQREEQKVAFQEAFREEWKKQFDELPEETQAVIFWNPLHPDAESLSLNVDKELQRRGL